MKKKALGRGLEALIPETEASGVPTTEIDIDLIVRNPAQPRFHFDEQGLEELAASIRANGVLQPLLVRSRPEGYQIVAGERRWLAAQRAGLMKVPVMVREVPDERLLELALVENIQREQLNPIEEAQAFQSLLETTGSSQEELSLRLGKERSTIANALRLLKLPVQTRQLVAERKLSPGHARALLSADISPAELVRAALLMVEKGWSVREAERWAKRRPKKDKLPKRVDPDVEAAADRLRLLFGTRIEIVTGLGKKDAGQIRIHFFSAEDLDRIYQLLTRGR